MKKTHPPAAILSDRERVALSLPALDERRRYSIEVAALYLGITRGFVYELIKRGEIATIKDGRRTFVPGAEVARKSCIAA